MPANRKEKIARVISTIQKRWGAQAIGRSSEHLSAGVPHIGSGFPDLDVAIGGGGIPRGRIIELVGVPTSGMTTVALTIVAQVQASEGAAVYIDLGRNFDPAYAQHCGVLLNRLALVHPFDTEQALKMLPDFVHNGGFDILICDLPAHVQQEGTAARRLTSTLGRLLAPLNKGNAILLFLTTLATSGSESAVDTVFYPQQAPLPHFTTVRLLLRRKRWLYRQRDVCGYEVQVIVIKNKLAAPGRQVHLAITFNETIIGSDQ